MIDESKSNKYTSITDITFEKVFASLTRLGILFWILGKFDQGINLALKRFQRESKGPPPRDLCAKMLGFCNKKPQEMVWVKQLRRKLLGRVHAFVGNS